METLEQNKEEADHSESSEASVAAPTLPNLRSTLIEVTEALHRTHELGALGEQLIENFQALPEEEPIFAERSQVLVKAFDLDTYELKILLLCYARERITASAALFASFHGSSERDQVSFRFSETLLSDASLNASTPTAPLRLWRLIEVDRQSTLADSPLRIDERILHFLSGCDTFDARLSPYFEQIQFSRIPAESALPYSHRIVQAWQQAKSFPHFPLSYLISDETEACLEVVSSLCQLTGLQAYTLRQVSLPEEGYERDALARLWQREALLAKCILYVDTINQLQARSQETRWIESIRGPVLLATKGLASNPIQRASISLELQAPDSHSRFDCVERHWIQFGIEADSEVEAICRSFQLSEAAIGRAADRALSQSYDSPLPLHQHFRHACKDESRRKFNQLTQRIEVCRSWDNLVLPEKQLETLRQVARQAEHRPKVYQNWGFGPQNPNGLGITALLAGSSGTGKTLAAEVIANELDLDLYRIDLSAVVSKYIGETEENLRNVFDAADTGGALLLFDECDSLFGTRSEVKDSHDRHANIEVSYLLQRMESYRGIALLTTNFKQAIDTAFLRRLRFIIDFPYPDTALRLRLWQGAFPADAPLGDLNYEALAQLSLSGGNIRNIALNAAFHAADTEQAIGMRHLQQAVRHELSKLERPIPESEIKTLLR